MAAEREVNIVIQWMQKHPGVVGKVKGQLNSLRAANAEVKKSVQGMNISDADREKVLSTVTMAYRRQQMALAGEVSPATRLQSEALEILAQKERDAATAANKNTMSSKRMATQLGRAGFRMMILGRMIMKAGIGPLNKMASTLRGWEKSMENTIIALGLQEAGMGETGMSAEELRAQVDDLITEGPKVETAMRGIGATMTQIAIDNAPALIAILKALQEILEGAGSSFIEGLVKGMQSAMNFIGPMAKALEGPLGEALGKITAALVLLSPLLIALGAVFLAVGTVAMLTLVPGIAAIAVPIALVTAGIVLLIAFFDDIMNVMAAFGRFAVEVFQGVVDVVNMLLDIIKAVLEPILKLLGAVGDLLGLGNKAASSTTGSTGTRSGNTEITVNNTYDIGQITSDVDLDRVVDASNRGIEDALMDREWNDPRE